MDRSTRALNLFKKVNSWEGQGRIVARLRRGIKNIDFPSSERVYVPRYAARKIIRDFEKRVCEYNRQQPIGSAIVSIRDGGILTPGRKNYYSTLRQCKITRHFSTCREILNPRKKLLTNPRNGRVYPRRSRMGRKLIRDCSTQ